MAPLWTGLHDKFAATLSHSLVNGGEGWRAIWRVFVEDQWFRDEVTKCAKALLRRSRVPCSVEDICHETLLLLARKLQRSPDLHYDTSQSKQHFAKWVHTLIWRDCREVLRTIRRHHHGELSIVDTNVIVDPRKADDFDLADAITFVSEPARSVLRLYQQGFSVRECSRRLGMHPSSGYRNMRRGIQFLQKQFSSKSE